MADRVQTVLEFGTFRLDPSERTLMDGSAVVPLAPKVFDTLFLLASNPGRMVSKEQLLAEVWQGSIVEENNLARNISVLRKVLGDAEGVGFIETVPKFGYRFIAEVRRTDGVTTEVFESVRGRVFMADAAVETTSSPVIAGVRRSGAVLPAAVPETQYVDSNGVSIAYQVVGSGDLDIVFVMGWVSHLEYFWKHYLFASFLYRLASFSRLILFDKRGTGLSDRVPNNELPTLEQRMEDVHAVMDAAGSERAVLVGVSEGGPMCSLFAATYPERTAALVMIGTYAKRIRGDDYPWAPTEEQRRAFFELMQRDWGGPVGIEERAPSMADDAEFRDWWATYLRMGASPGAAVALTRMNAEIDVRDILPLVRVPTLVIHRAGDMCLKAEEGRYVAARIPGAKYIELEGTDHLPFVGDQDAILNEIELFARTIGDPAGYDRVVATVVNMKFDSDAEILGIRDELRRQIFVFRGKDLSDADTGILAVFDGPARAIRCAKALTARAIGANVAARTGVHTGECDLDGERYGGFAVELARRIAARAVTGNILVSRTVKDLVAGSGLAFTEFGVERFDGVDGDWRLFTVEEQTL